MEGDKRQILVFPSNSDSSTNDGVIDNFSLTIAISNLVTGGGLGGGWRPWQDHFIVKQLTSPLPSKQFNTNSPQVMTTSYVNFLNNKHELFIGSIY